MVISLVAGFFLNYWSTKIANDKLLASLQEQLNAINKAQQTSRGAQSQVLANKKSDLEAQIEILSA